MWIAEKPATPRDEIGEASQKAAPLYTKDLATTFEKELQFANKFPLRELRANKLAVARCVRDDKFLPEGWRGGVRKNHRHKHCTVISLLHTC